MSTMSLSSPRAKSSIYFSLVIITVALAIAVVTSYGQPPQPAELKGVERIQADAAALAPTLKTQLAKDYIAGAKDLPKQETRTLYRDKVTRAWMSKADYDKLTDEQKKDVAERPLDESFYYNTGYGSPLSYVRALEVLGENGVTTLKGARVMDFGCGGIGPGRLFAAMGADAVGVDVEPLFPLYYNQPGDQGEVKTDRGAGKVSLITGRWPAEEGVRTSVGGGFDLILSKNTLKNGYIHPERPVDKRMLVDLGVDDAAYVKALYESLKPGGHVLIYNICPHRSKPEEAYVPWSDGRCPFSKELLESTGFKMIKFDEEDSAAARAMAKILGWDKGGMDLEGDLFAHYTLMRKGQ